MGNLAYFPEARKLRLQNRVDALNLVTKIIISLAIKGSLFALCKKPSFLNTEHAYALF